MASPDLLVSLLSYSQIRQCGDTPPHGQRVAPPLLLPPLPPLLPPTPPDELPPLTATRTVVALESHPGAPGATSEVSEVPGAEHARKVTSELAVAGMEKSDGDGGMAPENVSTFSHAPFTCSKT